MVTWIGCAFEKLLITRKIEIIHIDDKRPGKTPGLF